MLAPDIGNIGTHDNIETHYHQETHNIIGEPVHQQLWSHKMNAIQDAVGVHGARMCVGGVSPGGGSRGCPGRLPTSLTGVEAWSISMNYPGFFPLCWLSLNLPDHHNFLWTYIKVQIPLFHLCVRPGNLFCLIFLNIPCDSDPQTVSETPLLFITLYFDTVNLVYILGRCKERRMLKMYEIPGILLVNFSHSIIQRDIFPIYC